MWGNLTRSVRGPSKSAQGREFVIVSSEASRKRLPATFATTQHVPALLRPGSRAELQACLAVARRFSIAVYPISSGNNWGYGSRVPVADGSVVIDLEAAPDRIVDFSEEMGWVTVEPGVTQQQLFDYLSSRKSRLWLDATGSTPESSIVGNTMERGFGHTPVWRACSATCVRSRSKVLPDGEESPRDGDGKV